MSVTVADCMNLSSLKDATVVGGSGGLDRIVASVSVLEYAEISVLKDNLFSGNELIITAFICIKDDVDAQCQVLRHLYEKGIVAFALYYIGVFIPRLDEKLVLVADELNMPLIIMPQGNLELRYAEVISEVMEAIVFDKIHEKYYVPAILERIAQFSERQRTVENVLRIISDRFRHTIILTDELLKIAGQALWPTALNLDTEQLIADIKKQMNSLESTGALEIDSGEQNLLIFHNSFRLSGMRRMYLIVLMNETERISKVFDQNTLLQISESVQAVLSMRRYSDWSQSSDMLIASILDNDSSLMNKIANQKNIELEKINQMWILVSTAPQNENPQETFSMNQMILAESWFQERYKIAFVGRYENTVVCLHGECLMPENEDTFPFDFEKEILGSGDAMLLCFSDLKDRFEVRSAYNMVYEYGDMLSVIYEQRKVFHAQHLKFVAMCKKMMQSGENAVKDAIAPIGALLVSEHDRDSLETLSSFLLDAESSIPKTAELMHLHLNTVKYRLKIIRQKLNRNISKLPDSYELYLAVALHKLYRRS